MMVDDVFVSKIVEFLCSSYPFPSRRQRWFILRKPTRLMTTYKQCKKNSEKKRGKGQETDQGEGYKSIRGERGSSHTGDRDDQKKKEEASN
jgi:hypothetical protein